MSWVKIDDSFIDHPRIVGLSDRAFRVHIGALCYSARHLTDGFIPIAIAQKLTSAKVRKELLGAGVWTEPAEGEQPEGYWIHDYLDFNPSRESTLAKRRATSKAARSRWSNAKGEQDASPSAMQDALPDALGAGTGTGPGALQLGGGSGGRVEKARTPDLVFEAFCEVTGVDWHELSQARRGALNGMITAVREHGGSDPEEIRRRAENYHATFSTPLTPETLTRRWAELSAARPGRPQSKGHDGASKLLAEAQELERQGR